ncbi:hypothetical protein LINGRAHAP2_LOCUS2350 [Linum grandiflorum]
MESLPSCISNAKLYVVISAGKIQSGQDRCRVSLLGRVFWPLPKPLYALHHDLARQWKIRPREVQVFEVGHGLIQFLFTSEDVKNMVLKNQPWCYKNHILNLIPWETPSQPVVDRLQFMALTVQLLEVPQHCLTTEFGKEVMAPVGEVLSADMYTTLSRWSFEWTSWPVFRERLRRLFQMHLLSTFFSVTRAFRQFVSFADYWVISSDLVTMLRLSRPLQVCGVCGC